MKTAFTILALFAFAMAGEAQTAKWTQQNDKVLRADLAAGKPVEQIAQALGSSPRYVRNRAKLLRIAVPEPAPVDLSNPTEKRVLVSAYRLNQIDMALIEGLRAKGFTVMFCGPDVIEVTHDEADWSDKSKPPASTSMKTGSVFADFLPGEFPSESVRAFKGFVFPDADRSTGLKLPVEAILKSSALVVMGEAPSVSSGEKLLLSTPLSGNATARSYQINSSSNRIAYIVRAISGKGMTKTTATAEGDQKFASEKLLPAVLSGL